MRWRKDFEAPSLRKKWRNKKEKVRKQRKNKIKVIRKKEKKTKKKRKNGNKRGGEWLRSNKK